MFRRSAARAKLLRSYTSMAAVQILLLSGDEAG
jgi:hypothetical protein